MNTCLTPSVPYTDISVVETAPIVPYIDISVFFWTPKKFDYRVLRTFINLKYIVFYIIGKLNHLPTLFS